ncbi:MAG: hypothetical protein HUU49_02255 [Candidatus Buchananbacteria bacterium]|nr:hypothetical protein [Candidatus Buchananbacteria bacterium]
MKPRIYFFITLLFGTLFFSACHLKEEYAVQYSFINELSTVTKVEPTGTGLKLEIPFADFSCDVANVKGVLKREMNTFILTLQGNETDQRCSQKFAAEITGIKPGDYEIKVVYLKGDQEQQVMYEKFTVSK